MKIAINAQMITGQGGGIEPFMRGLVYGLGQLTDGDEEYVIVINAREKNWLKDVLGPNQTVVAPPSSIKDTILGLITPYKKYLGKWMEKAMMRKAQLGPQPSDGYYESLGVDLIHFAYQDMILSDIPSIFNPHDLQHAHLPHLFGEGTLAYRNVCFPAWSKHAQYVVTESDFVKRDLMAQYQLSADKIFTIRRGAPTDLYQKPNTDVLTQLKQKLPFEEFIFFPAQTWPHKNHIKLVEALALLRNEAIKINLVCSGGLKAHYFNVKELIDGLKLNDQVHFAGYVTDEELIGLYELSEFVVFPTLFEGGGFPVLEAFSLNKALCSSNIAPLLEIGGDAALFFNPEEPADIAKALKQLHNNESLKQSLIKKGSEKVRHLSWIKTAKAYRALYRLTLNGSISEADQEALAQGASI